MAKAKPKVEKTITDHFEANYKMGPYVVWRNDTDADIHVIGDQMQGIPLECLSALRDLLNEMHKDGVLD